MKTRCPNCQTVFRITSEQLNARAGKVRCGRCRAIFNAFDSLLAERIEKRPAPASRPAVAADTRAKPVSAAASVDTRAKSNLSGIVLEPSIFSLTDELEIQEIEKNERSSSFEMPHIPVKKQKEIKTVERVLPRETSEIPGYSQWAEDVMASPIVREPSLSTPTNEPEIREAEENEHSSPHEIPPVPVKRRERVKTTKPILPREPGEIPGHSQWTEDVMAPPIGISSEKPLRWPFMLAMAGLLLVLAGQALFHFRSELAVSLPSLRSTLETFSHAFGASLPLPRHTEQVSIETSDLQTDLARGNLLVMNATLRNKAPYGQAYPSLELSLTDTQDTVIARRVFAPQDYLPARTAANPVFSGNSDVAVRLWIDAVDLAAAGYRLFVFYP
jgi:predicted Zn finger-like uncharacterized protein